MRLVSLLGLVSEQLYLCPPAHTVPASLALPASPELFSISDGYWSVLKCEAAKLTTPNMQKSKSAKASALGQ